MGVDLAESTALMGAAKPVRALPGPSVRFRFGAWRHAVNTAQPPITDGRRSAAHEAALHKRLPHPCRLGRAIPGAYGLQPPNRIHTDWRVQTSGGCAFQNLPDQRYVEHEAKGAGSAITRISYGLPGLGRQRVWLQSRTSAERRKRPLFWAFSGVRAPGTGAVCSRTWCRPGPCHRRSSPKHPVALAPQQFQCPEVGLPFDRVKGWVSSGLPQRGPSPRNPPSPSSTPVASITRSGTDVSTESEAMRSGTDLTTVRGA